MQRSKVLLLASALSFFSALYPYATLAVIVLSAFSSRAFNPFTKDSIYSPGFRRNTSLALLILSILEGVTGFGSGPSTSTVISNLTFGILTRGLSLELHLALVIPLGLLFTLHTVSGFGSLLVSRGVKNQVIYSYVIPITWIFLYLAMLYLDLEYFL